MPDKHTVSIRMTLEEARYHLELSSQQDDVLGKAGRILLAELDRIRETLPVNGDSDVILPGSTHWYCHRNRWIEVSVTAIGVAAGIRIQIGDHYYGVRPYRLFTSKPAEEEADA